MTLCQVDFEPVGLRAECVPGTTLLQAARDAGLNLVSLCGGDGVCGRCVVRVIAGSVSLLTQTERQVLDACQIADGARLACLTRVLGSVKADVPLTSRTVAQRLELTGVEVDVPFEPAVREYLLALTPPSVREPRSDWSLLLGGLEARSGRSAAAGDLFAVQRLPELLRAHGWRVRASLRGDEVVDVRAPHSPPLGLAIDIGTTKVAAYLVDMETGGTLAVEGITNPQIAYGEDVMSRISYAMKGGGERLTGAIVGGLNELIARMCPEPERIVEAVVAGNTTMHHLFTGLPVRQLGLAPYNPVVSEPLEIKARDLGLRIAPGAYVYLLPNVAGFVGADHVAMILATGLDRIPRTALGLDIGTNTEVVLARRGELLSCSTASGPAFEGAHIRHGMRAANGAVEQVQIAGDRVQVRTVGDAPAIGLCGSGVLDAISELARVGRLNRRGKLAEGPGVRDGACSEGDARQGGREFVVVPANESGTGHDVTLTERDIGEVLLAKAAIRTGIDVLLQHAGASPEELDEVVIAGAFGTHISVASAIHLGMLPALPLEQIRQVGNAAGVGARLALVSASQRVRAVEIARRVRYLELMTQPDFATRFARAMYLPE